MRILANHSASAFPTPAAPHCLSPVVKVLNDSFGIERGYMAHHSLLHQLTRILDALTAALRRARSAAVSQIPTTTGAAKAVGKVIPELKGKAAGISVKSQPQPVRWLTLWPF